MANRPKIPVVEEGSIVMISREDAIIKLLELTKKWLTSKEIADTFSIPYTTIHPDLVEMAKHGKILKRTVRRHKAGRRPTQWGYLGMQEE